MATQFTEFDHWHLIFNRSFPLNI